MATDDAPTKGSDDTESELAQLDYYTLLGCSREAGRDELRAAFRRFAIRYHPDRFVDEAPALAARALAIYRRGSEAIEVLSDEAQRRAYDALLARGVLRLRDEARTPARGPTNVPAPAAAVPLGAAPRPAPARRSPQAKAFHDRAQAALGAGDLRGAWKMLKAAVEAEPADAELERLLHAVEQRLRG